MAIVQTGLTLDEFLKWPEEKPAFEFVDGVVTRKMSPKGPQRNRPEQVIGHPQGWSRS